MNIYSSDPNNGRRCTLLRENKPSDRKPIDNGNASPRTLGAGWYYHSRSIRADTLDRSLLTTGWRA